MSSDNWIDIVNRIHSQIMRSNMALMKKLIIEDEVKLNALQRQFIRNLIKRIVVIIWILLCMQINLRS